MLLTEKAWELMLVEGQHIVRVLLETGGGRFFAMIPSGRGSSRTLFISGCCVMLRGQIVKHSVAMIFGRKNLIRKIHRANDVVDPLS